MVRDLVSPRHYSPFAFFIGAPRHAEAAITNLEARPSRAKSLGSVAESRPLSPARLSRRFEIQRAQLLRAREEASVYHLAPIICPARGSSLRCNTVALESESTGRLIRAIDVAFDGASLSVDSRGIELRFQRGNFWTFALHTSSSMPKLRNTRIIKFSKFTKLDTHATQETNSPLSRNRDNFTRA